jgi:hypothetical protein
MKADPPPDVAGLVLDGAEDIVISAVENAALCAVMGVPPAPGGEAHPSYFYSATQVGMGLTVAHLCSECHFDVEDGPMLASSEAVFHAPLLTETPYRVRGEVVSLTRKASRKLGSMDLLEYRLRLVAPDGTMAVETTNLWVLPRGAA